MIKWLYGQCKIKYYIKLVPITFYKAFLKVYHSKNDIRNLLFIRVITQKTPLVHWRPWEWRRRRRQREFLPISFYVYSLPFHLFSRFCYFCMCDLKNILSLEQSWLLLKDENITDKKSFCFVSLRVNWPRLITGCAKNLVLAIKSTEKNTLIWRNSFKLMFKIGNWVIFHS